MTTITEAQRVALVKAADALWDRWNDEAYYVVNDLLDNATIEDTTPLWRDSDREDWMREGSIHLELVDAPCIAVEMSRGLSVLIEDDSDTVAVPPEHLPAFIAMLTEVQRRIEAGEAK